MSRYQLNRLKHCLCLFSLSVLIALPYISLAAEQTTPEIVVVVHKESNIETLTDNQVRLLFLGRTPSLAVTPIIIDYKSSNPLRERFYVTATGKSLAFSVRSWARYAFSGRGFPPVLVTSQSDIEELLISNPQQHIAYIEKPYLTSNMRVVFTVPNGND